MRSFGQNPSEAELQDMINEVDVDGKIFCDLQDRIFHLRNKNISTKIVLPSSRKSLRICIN